MRPTHTITLAYTDESGEQTRAVVRRSPFFIGSAPGSDLRLRSPSVSQRHARVELIGGRPYLSDCESEEGTTLNRRPVAVAVELRDGDRIGIGGALVLSVRLDEARAEQTDSRAAASPLGATANTPTAGEALAVLLSNPAVAGACIGLILLLTVGLVLLLVRGTGEPPTDMAGVTNASAPPRTPAATPTTSASPSAGEPAATPTASPAAVKSPGDGTQIVDSREDEQIGGAVRRVMSRISDDNSPYVPDSGVEDVTLVVRGYKGSSSLAERLRAMSGARAEVSALARSIRIKPALLAYAALAQSEDGGPPAATARKMSGTLNTLRATFGTESANRTLLLVAAYLYRYDPRLGTRARIAHPLDVKLRQLGGKGSNVDISEAGTVWFLRKQNGITDEAYQLVVRMLAIGVIAESPRRYGVDAEPPPY